MSECENPLKSQEIRKKRVKRLKKVLIIFLLFLIMIPIIICFFLLYKIDALENKIEFLYQTREENLEQQYMEELNHETIDEEIVINTLPEPKVNKEAMGNNTVVVNAGGDKVEKYRKIYLTFDDGPSIYTEEILNILSEYGVKATFFVTGKTDAASKLLFQQIVEEGHTLGMHSNSHVYGKIYESLEAFSQDFYQIRDLLYETTGVMPAFYRFPGGSSNTVSATDMQEFITFLTEENISYFDWNISSGDASSNELDADAIINNCTDQLQDYNSAVILLHDAYDKKTTVDALPVIIEKILKMDHTVLLPITDQTELIQHIKVND